MQMSLDEESWYVELNCEQRLLADMGLGRHQNDEEDV